MLDRRCLLQEQVEGLFGTTILDRGDGPVLDVVGLADDALLLELRRILQCDNAHPFCPPKRLNVSVDCCGCPNYTSAVYLAPLE